MDDEQERTDDAPGIGADTAGDSDATIGDDGADTADGRSEHGRRVFLTAAGTGLLGSIAGCSALDGLGSGDGTPTASSTPTPQTNVRVAAGGEDLGTAESLVFADGLATSTGGSTTTVDATGPTIADNARSLGNALDLSFGDGFEVSDGDGGSVTVSATQPDGQLQQAYHYVKNPPEHLVASRPLFSTADRTVHVSADGSDDAPGTEERPVGTLQAVADSLPYFLLHSFEVIVHGSDEGPATADDGEIRFPPIGLAGRNDGSLLVRAAGDDPGRHVIEADGLSSHMKSARHGDLSFEGLELHCPVRPYDGVQRWSQCAFAPDGPSVFEPSGGSILVEECTFGEAEHLITEGGGAHAVLRDCTGSIGGALVDNDGLNPVKLYVGGSDVSSDGYVTDETVPSIVVEDGLIHHPTEFKQ